MNTIREKYIEINKYRILALMLCSAITLFLFSVADQNVYDYRKIILAFMAYAVLSIVKIEIPSLFYKIYEEIMLIAMAVSSYWMIELINYDGVTVDQWRIIVNAVLVYIFAKAIIILTRSLRISIITTLLIVVVYAIANNYVWEYRGKPIMPWDISAISTAATVASTYELYVSKFMVYSFMICVILVFLTYTIRRDEANKTSWRYILSQIILVVFIISSYSTYVYPTLVGDMWHMEEIFYSDGVLGGFIGNIRYCQVEKPRGYNSSEVEEKLQNAEVISAVDSVTAKNIIVIMNESYSDLRLINDEIISDEYMPYMDSLTENVIRGTLAVPIFGGNTCDSEFEVLVSASTAFSTPIPYNTALNRPTESLVSYLKERGYYAEAFHPYLGNNWNRPTVYNNLGFDVFLDQESMDSPEYVRWCISDKANYEKIMEEYEAHKGENFFMFNITMQNHGGYELTFEHFEESADLSVYGNYPQAEQYLSLIKRSDESLQGLIEYFSTVEEPTLICFFGDHLPSVETGFYNLLYGKDISDLTPEERQLMYATPMLI